MEDRIDEGLPQGTEEAIPLYKTEYKSKENCICSINGNLLGTGFFCKVKVEGNLTPVLITNYHVVNDAFMNQNTKLTFYIKNDLHSIDIKYNKIYSSIRDKYDMMIIRLKEGEVNNYLEIDENIFKYDSVNNYKNEGIYILHYPKAEEAKVSKGKGIEKVNNYDIKYFCHTEPGSSGGPILSNFTNKVIGIHKGSIAKYGKCVHNIGTFLGFPLGRLIYGDKVSKNNNYYFI
jgi:V8-like Glu-specific endopeptidase